MKHNLEDIKNEYYNPILCERNDALTEDEKTESSGCISGNNVCSGGHTILWGGDPNYEIPTGCKCSCGQTKVYYEICATCGHKKMEFR